MELEKIAAELKEAAEKDKLTPQDVFSGREITEDHAREFTLDGLELRIILTHNQLTNRVLPHLSIGIVGGGNPLSIPEGTVSKIKTVFFGEEKVIEFPSMLGNTRQFICFKE